MFVKHAGMNVVVYLLVCIHMYILHDIHLYSVLDKEQALVYYCAETKTLYIYIYIYLNYVMTHCEY